MSQQDEPPPGQDEEAADRQNLSLALGNEMVRLYKDLFGRGPTKTRVNWCGPDVLTVILEDTFTPVERSLVRLGQHQRVRDVRLFFQYAALREFCEPVERLTGRKVRTFVSGVDTDANGFSTETFALHPEGYDGPSRADGSTF